MPDQATTPAPEATMKVRAKMHCMSVEQTKDAPFTTQRYVDGQLTDVLTWPRTYRFNCVYDQRDVPEDQQFSLATPSGSMQLLVDNPAVSFTPGQAYYIDIAPAPATTQEPHRG